jgi:hypothetical protein
MFIPDPGSEFCPYRIQGQKDFGIPDPDLQNLSILTQKLFLSSRKYDPGCSSRIRILIFLPILDPGVKVEGDGWLG